MRGFILCFAALCLTACGRSQRDQCLDEVNASCDYSARCANQSDAVKALCKAQLASTCSDTRCGLADGGSSGTYSATKSEECAAGYATAVCGTPPSSCAEVCQP